MLTKFASSVHEQSMSLYVRVRQSVGKMELGRDQEVSQSNGPVLKRQRNYRLQANITCSFLVVGCRGVGGRAGSQLVVMLLVVVPRQTVRHLGDDNYGDDCELP